MYYVSIRLWDSFVIEEILSGHGQQSLGIWKFDDCVTVIISDVIPIVSFQPNHFPHPINSLENFFRLMFLQTFVPVAVQNRGLAHKHGPVSVHLDRSSLSIHNFCQIQQRNFELLGDQARNLTVVLVGNLVSPSCELEPACTELVFVVVDEDWAVVSNPVLISGEDENLNILQTREFFLYFFSLFLSVSHDANDLPLAESCGHLNPTYL